MDKLVNSYIIVFVVCILSEIALTHEIPEKFVFAVKSTVLNCWFVKSKALPTFHLQENLAFWINKNFFLILKIFWRLTSAVLS